MARPKAELAHSLMVDDVKFLQKAVVVSSKHPETFLIVKRSEISPSRPGHWDFPGGNVGYGEKHDDSLLREIAEETGINAYIVRPVFVSTHFDTQKELYTLYIGHLCSCETDEVQLSEEHTSFRWVSLKEFENLATKDEQFLIDTARAALQP